MNFFLLLNTKKDILNYVGNQTVDEWIFFFRLWKSTRSTNCLVTEIIQNIFLCVQQKKEILTGLKQLEG